MFHHVIHAVRWAGLPAVFGVYIVPLLYRLSPCGHVLEHSVVLGGKLQPLQVPLVEVVHGFFAIEALDRHAEEGTASCGDNFRLGPVLIAFYGVSVGATCDAFAVAPGRQR